MTIGRTISYSDVHVTPGFLKNEKFSGLIQDLPLLRSPSYMKSFFGGSLLLKV